VGAEFAQIAEYACLSEWFEFAIMCALDPASEVRLFAPPLSSTESSPPFKSSRLQPRGLAIGDVMAALPNHSLGEDKMQLAVDQLTRCIKVTGVGGGLRHDVEHDLTEAVEPPGAEEVGPPRRYCIKGATGDNPIGMLDIWPCTCEALPRRAPRRSRSRRCQTRRVHPRLRFDSQL